MTPKRRIAAAAGFTVLELTLALMLSSVVVMAAISLIGMVHSADQRLAVRLDESVDLALAQGVVRKAMSSLVAAPPLTDAQAAEPAGEKPAEEEKDEGDKARDDMKDLLTAVTRDEKTARALVDQKDELPRFELALFLGPGGMSIPRLEVVVLEPPAPPGYGEETLLEDEVLGQPVRGAFELSEDLDGYFVLTWRQINPARRPVVLLRRLVRCEWLALPRERYGGQWVDVDAQYIQERFPVAVRLLLWTAAGTHIDWLFDTAVVTETQ